MSNDSYSPITSLSAANGPATKALWAAPTADGALNATLTIPGSKSLTNRELVLAALAEGPSKLIAPLHSRDSERMIAGLTELGVTFTAVDGSGAFGPDLLVTPPDQLRSGGTVACGQAGTVMRFLPPVAGLVAGEVHFDADDNALHRPMGPMIRALRELGVDVDDAGRWSLPFSVRGHGHVRGGELDIDASTSSQFVSGLLLAASRFDVGMHLRHTGPRLPSVPHIDMTVEALQHRGVRVERPSPREWVVAAGPIRAKDIAVEPDLSNASPFLAAAMVAGGTVSITGWPLHSTQPGALLTEILPQMGARVHRRAGILTVTGRGILGANLDLSAAGELTPTLVALAALADAPSHFTGIGHLRLHETDRLAALANEINALGGEVTVLEDGLRIVPRPLRGGVWHTYHDHRMATTGAILGLAVPGIEIQDIETTAKTLPEFTALWQSMLEGGDATA
ncbi:MAG: 3-phosphoshikimate 1-carboxyvinyltransferase [Microbacteriaceae bacterium]|jgi:3-phosphoshikimate 1-carboxyvinyltransferase|nr:3-phosphoshikimate 1-carboxyvinyltransferase [Microbacteriaceae bacterium]HPZ35300.1 3-phosphoshikimate 1-carboxyvinyltransferase [Microbacteriaceae bacterium]HQC93790.1 3-phosphoshikimate 1-carboxyvinyltransferase [Microbacteriaceae bacterium]